MAKRKFDFDEFGEPQPSDAVATEPAEPQKSTSKKELNPVEKALAAIAALRQNDAYAQVNNADCVQYRDSAGRLVVNVNKLAEKDVARRDAKSLASANDLLAAYKNFTIGNVFTSSQNDDVLTIVSTDGAKYHYKIITGQLQ